MKSIIKRGLLVLSGATAFASPAMAAVSFMPGDLVVAFYEYSGTTTAGLDPDTYVFNLGQASLYRDNANQTNVPVSTVNSSLVSSNIGLDLASAFGADWASSGTVRWTVVGIVGASDGTVAGDPARTSYYSTSSTTGTVPVFTSGIYGTFTTQLLGFRNGVNGADQTAGVNAAGVTIPISSGGSLDEYLPPQQGGTYFGSGVDPRQAFDAGFVPGTLLEGSLDLYRMTNTTPGRTGSYIGTLTLDSAGNLGVIPEPSSSLLGIAGAAFGLFFRKRRSSASA